MLEHANYTFAFRDVSRVFTHELVRHRAGSAFSQESLRYVRLSELAFRVPPALEPIREQVLTLVERLEEFQVDAAGRLGMDDAGVPGLLSAPYYGYCDKTDPVYRSTRRFSLSPRNPFFYTGKALSGLGSPHSKPDFVWPMGIIMQGFTVQPEENLCAILDMVAHADDGTGYVHESVHKDDPSRYTRPWFAWVNSLYSELLIKTYVK